MIRFSRMGLFITGIVILLLLFYTQRYLVFSNSNFTYGATLFDPSQNPVHGYDAEMRLLYYVDMHVYQQDIMEDISLANKPVTVRYPQRHPEQGKIYIASRFWIESALWLLLPIIFWCAFVFTIMNSDTRIEIDWRKQG